MALRRISMKPKIMRLWRAVAASSERFSPNKREGGVHGPLPPELSSWDWTQPQRDGKLLMGVRGEIEHLE